MSQLYTEFVSNPRHVYHKEENLRVVMVQSKGYFRARSVAKILLAMAFSLFPAAGQQTPILPQQPGPRVGLPAPQGLLTLTLPDALARALRYETSFLAAASI